MRSVSAAEAGWRATARGLRRCARRIRNRLCSASVILLYHRVAEGLADPWSLCVRPVHFGEHMEVLRRRGLVVALDALAAALGGGRRRRAVVVTFDDGYADFAARALPVLRRLELPTTLFVSTEGLEAGGEFWWDELERIVLRPATVPDALRLEIGGHRCEWAAGDGRDRLYHALHRRLGRLPQVARAQALAALRRWAGVDDGARATHRRLSVAELEAVAASGCVRIGSHTVSHAHLSHLAVEEQRREIGDSRRRLEEIVGEAVDHFSYPHGDFTSDTVALVREAGFRVACGTACAPVLPGADLFRLPRVEVPDVSGDAFARWLDEWVG
jgi:peptidoglycan/xylan/chitin deacetylase (PgdA/CDA1 family)